MNFKKKIWLIICVVFVLIIASACSNADHVGPVSPVDETAASKDSNREQSSGSNEEQAGLEINADPVTLQLGLNVGWMGEWEVDLYFTNPVKERYPHIELEIINLSDPDFALDKLVVTGQIPDLVMSANPIIYVFTDTGMEDNIEPLIEKYRFDLSKLNENAVASIKTATGNDFLNGLPWTMHFNATYYNKDIFDKFGVPYPYDGMTWEEARELAVRLTRFEDGVQYRGLETDSPSHFASIFSQPFIDVETNKASLNNDVWKRAFSFMKSVYDIEGNHEYVWPLANLNQFLREQRLAMLPSLNLLSHFKNADGFNWDLSQYPQFEDYPNTGTQVDAWILHITKQSEHKDQAFLVLETVLSEEVQIELARNARFPIMDTPAIQEQFGKGQDYLQGKNLQAAFLTTPSPALPATPLNNHGQPILQAAFHRYMDGTDLNTVLLQAEEELNQKIAEVLGGS